MAVRHADLFKELRRLLQGACDRQDIIVLEHKASVGDHHLRIPLHSADQYIGL